MKKKDDEGDDKDKGDKKDEKPKDEEKKDEKKEKEAAAAAEWTEKRAAAEKVAEADFLGRTMAHAYVDEMRKIAAAAASEEKLVGAAQVLKTAAAAVTKEIPAAVVPAATKEASAIDELAINRALAMLKEFNKTAGDKGGFNEEEAVNRLQAVYTLGLGESTKVASATTPEAGIEVRALEFLDAAGYPVQWAA
jgi:hypothetical protein